MKIMHLFVSFLFLLVMHLNAGNPTYQLLIGTYTNNSGSEGIYTYEIDIEKGVFKPKFIAKELVNPSFLAISADHQFVYAVSESAKTSQAGAFALDARNGTLKFLNSSSTGGKGPCHIAVSEHHVLTANYGGGSISVFARRKDGSLSGLIQQIKQTGKSVDSLRQTKSYAHQVVFTPDKKHVLACDLGTDKVMVYAYDATRSERPLIVFDSVFVKAGSGPRHLTISKDGQHVYLLQELDGTVTVMSLKSGNLTIIQETSVVLQEGIEAAAADIHLSPDGKFLYASNRGTSNNISCFSVAKDGTLRLVDQVSTLGIWPRNFAITPDGKYLFVGNQQSNCITVFKRNVNTGQLKYTGKKLQVGAPVCLLFY